jgi:hypothetical protein
LAYIFLSIKLLNQIKIIMPDTERITNPSMGSNELGTETNEPRQTGGLSAGTDTQLNLTAAGHKKSKKQKKIDEDKREIDKQVDFFEVEETDE